MTLAKSKRLSKKKVLWYSETVSSRVYGQYCGLARALEMVGERWAMLIVRDLLVGPRRFSDLHRGLNGIPTNVLTARLKELELAGIVRRRVLPRPATSVVYELTEYGRELEATVIALGRWGAKSLGDVREGEAVTVDSLVMALRSTFRTDTARRVRATFELRLGDIVLHARVRDGALEVAEGSADAPDLIIETGPAMRALMAREISADEALRNGSVRLDGDAALLPLFAELFAIDPMPAA